MSYVDDLQPVVSMDPILKKKHGYRIQICPEYVQETQMYREI